MAKDKIESKPKPAPRSKYTPDELCDWADRVQAAIGIPIKQEEGS